MVTCGERKAFDTLKQWLSQGQHRGELGLRALRQRVLMPKKAHSINDYESVVAEWDRALAELQGFGGEIPNYIDILDAHMRLLDIASHGWAVDLKATWSASGAYLGDAPQECLAKVRTGVESRIQQFRQHGAHAPLAGMGYTPPPPMMPLGSLELPAEPGDMDDDQLQRLAMYHLDALQKRKGKGKGKGKKGACFNCGSTEHWADQCPPP